MTSACSDEYRKLLETGYFKSAAAISSFNQPHLNLAET